MAASTDTLHSVQVYWGLESSGRPTSSAYCMPANEWGRWYRTLVTLHIVPPSLVPRSDGPGNEAKYNLVSVAVPIGNDLPT